MRRIQVIVVSGVAALAVATGPAMAAPPGSDDGERPAPTLASTSPHGLDVDALRRADDQGSIAVMLELQTPPASQAYSRSRSSGEARRATRAAIAKVEAAQARVIAQLQDADVLYTSANVYAGVAVRTDVDTIEELAALPGVKAVHRLTPKERTNFAAIPLVSAPRVWTDTGVTGAGIRIGIIDTGIDYTHADFGGPGTAEAYEEALAAKEAGRSPEYPDPSKVAGGYDFAGNDYTGENIPTRDDNPLDCDGHGTHVAGTAAGYGVAQDGSTYAGPWDGQTPFDTMAIGPGVAPEATLYALKVFGCTGSTWLVVPALDWAADPNGDGDFSDRLDVVNMSLGSSYGSTQDPDAVASNNLTDLGTAVIASAGNDGDVYEITGSPGVASKVLSVAASQDNAAIMDGFQATLGGETADYPGLASSAYPWTTSPDTTASAVQLGDWDSPPGPANNTDGCEPLSEADAAAVAGRIVLLQWDDRDATRRCGSAGRTGNVAEAGAAGAILGSQVPLPEVGILGTESIPAILSARDGTDALHTALLEGTEVEVTLTASLLNAVRVVITGPDDPTDSLADFTSRGTALAGNVKPDVSAPGSTIFSAASGTGSAGTSLSGTSMAAPVAAGVAALVRASHPTWTSSQVKAAIMNTADHDLFLRADRTGPRYDVMRAGSGRVDAAEAVATQAIMAVVDDPGAVSVSFGVLNVQRPGSRTKTVRITDLRSTGSRVTYSLDVEMINSVPGATYSLSRTAVTLRPGQSANVRVTLSVDPTRLVHRADPTVALYPLGDPPMRDFLTVASGLIVAEPSDSSPVLRVPVFSAPRPASTLTSGSAAVRGSGSVKNGVVTLRGDGVDNRGADRYERVRSRVSALQLAATSPRLPWCEPGISTGCVVTDDDAAADLRYVGQTSDALLISDQGQDPLSPESSGTAYFAVTTWQPWRTASELVRFYVNLDTNNDGTADLLLLNASWGPDTFVALAVSLRPEDEGALVSLRSLNDLPGSSDTALLHSNAMVLPLTLADLANPVGNEGQPLEPFIRPGRTTVSYWIEASTIAGTVIDVVGQPRVPLRINLTEPPVTAFTSSGMLPAPSARGTRLAVRVDTAQAGDVPSLLVIQHLNTLARKAEVVRITW